MLDSQSYPPPEGRFGKGASLLNKINYFICAFAIYLTSGGRFSRFEHTVLGDRRFIRHPSLPIVVVEVEGVHCALGDEPREHMPVSTAWAMARWAFAFIDGTEVGGLNFTIIEFGYSI